MSLKCQQIILSHILRFISMMNHPHLSDTILCLLFVNICFGSFRVPGYPLQNYFIYPGSTFTTCANTSLNRAEQGHMTSTPSKIHSKDIVLLFASFLTLVVVVPVVLNNCLKWKSIKKNLFFIFHWIIPGMLLSFFQL